MSTILWDAIVIFSFIFVSGVFFVIDDIVGTAVRAFFYNLTHKESLPVGVKKGFIEGKKVSERLIPTILVAIFSFWLFNGIFAATTVGKFFLFFVALAGTTVGFIAGPWFSRIYSKKDKALRVIDKLESGEIDLTEEAKELAGKVRQSVSGYASTAISEAGGAISTALAEAEKHIYPNAGVKDQPETAAIEKPADDVAAPQPAPEDPQAQEAAEVEKARKELHDLIG